MRIAIHTLGCKVNQYETQALEQELLRRGHTLVDFEDEADAYIVNTCSVTAVSDKKSRQMLRRAQQRSPGAVIAACGCYAQTHADDVAALGVDVRKYKLLIIGGATLATASAVCISGTIGWVGLVIPHIGRMLVGNDNTRLIPVSISLGACFLTVIDILSRTITRSELPIGILCALIGTPFFVYLLKKTRGGSWA